VLVHQFDAIDQDGTTKRGVHAEWAPCSRNEWCTRFSDRFSASVINRRVPYLYDAKQPGFILQPFAVDRAFLCGYKQDGGTMGKVCSPPGISEQCVPGCRLQRPTWSDGLRRSRGQLWQLLEEQEEDMISGLRNGVRSCGQDTCYYNELVLSANVWVQHLPQIIEAIFFPKFAHDAEGKARSSLWRFHMQYPGVFVPLVSLDLANIDAPFEVVES